MVALWVVVGTVWHGIGSGVISRLPCPQLCFPCSQVVVVPLAARPFLPGGRQTACHGGPCLTDIAWPPPRLPASATNHQYPMPDRHLPPRLPPCFPCGTDSLLACHHPAFPAFYPWVGSAPSPRLPCVDRQTPACNR